MTDPMVSPQTNAWRKQVVKHVESTRVVIHKIDDDIESSISTMVEKFMGASQA